MSGFHFKKNTLIYLFCILSLFAFNSKLYAQAKEKKSKKYRVAMLDFTATNVSRQYADIVRRTFEVSLYKTGVFEILERQQMSQVLKEQEFQLSGCVDSSCAVQIGQLLSAEMIVIGSIDKITGYTISVKFVDVEKGKIFIADKINAKSDKDIQEATDSLAEKIADIINKQKREPLAYWLYAGFTYPYTSGNTADILDPGYAGTISFFVDNILGTHLMMGLEGGYWLFPGKTKNTDKFTMITGMASIAYRIMMLENLYLMPVISGGAGYNTISYDKDGYVAGDKPVYTSEKAIEPVAKGGIRLGIILNNRLDIYLSSEYGMIFESGGNMPFIGFSAGAGIRL